ncbi:hypothetical protein [Kordiimonas sp.]|uniref:hypothetical protein n=1 Tax=Kordiimonas sp. TaxID=1970157 RepID=UPI003A8FAEC8
MIEKKAGFFGRAFAIAKAKAAKKDAKPFKSGEAPGVCLQPAPIGNSRAGRAERYAAILNGKILSDEVIQKAAETAKSTKVVTVFKEEKLSPFLNEFKDKHLHRLEGQK